MSRGAYMLGLLAMGMGALIALAIISFEMIQRFSGRKKLIPAIIGVLLILIPILNFCLKNRGINYYHQLFIYIFRVYDYENLVPDVIVGAVIYCLLSGGCFLLGILITYIIASIITDKVIDRKLKV